MALTRHSDNGILPSSNERGAALIIVLVMLLLLTILGATLFTSSTTEIKIAGNYRTSLETFSAADAAVEFAMTYDTIYTYLIPGSKTSWPEAGEGKILNDDLSEGALNDKNPHFNRITIPNTNIQADIKVDLVAARNNPPPGSGYQEDAGVQLGGEQSFKSNVFAITVEAHGPNNARTDVEAGMARVVSH